MGRQAGRRGRIYMGIASDTATAEPLPFIAKWKVDAQTDKIDVTAMGDTGKVYVGGLPDQSGDFSGFWDDATQQTYTAAVDGLARKFYLYPNIAVTTTYWFGTILPDFSASSDVGGAIELSASWAAASPIIKVG